MITQTISIKTVIRFYGIDRDSGYEPSFFLCTASALGELDALLTILVFFCLASALSCLGSLAVWWLVSKKVHSKRKEMEVSGCLKG